MNCSTLRPSARHTAITYIHRGGYTLSPHSPTRWHPSCPHPKQQSPRLLQLQWAAAQRVLPLQLRYCAHKHTHILPPAFSLYCPSQFLFSFQLYFFSSTTLLLPPHPYHLSPYVFRQLPYPCWQRRPSSVPLQLQSGGLCYVRTQQKRRRRLDQLLWSRPCVCSLHCIQIQRSV